MKKLITVTSATLFALAGTAVWAADVPAEAGAKAVKAAKAASAAASAAVPVKKKKEKKGGCG